MGLTNKGGRSKTIPGRHEEQMRIAVVALGTSENFALWFNNSGKTVRVKKVTFVPDDAHSGAATNNMILSATNRGVDGLGSTVIATKTYISGVDLVAFLGDDITLSTTEANTEVPDLASISFDKGESGTGLASPAGVAILEFEYI